MNGNGEKKKFLFVSWESLSGDLAWAIKKEGHDVKIFVKKDVDKDVYGGILDRVEDWEKHADWADVIVFDDTGFGEIADKLRKQGKKVVGGSKYTDQLEEDRDFGQAEMRRVDMQTLISEEFTNFDDAIKFVQNNPGRYVFKPSGQISSEQKGLLFVGEEDDGKDLIEVMAHNKRVWSKKIPRFVLQKYAQGVEVAVGSFFNGHEFMLPINVNFEHKRLFPGDIGPLTGEMGCYDDQTEVLTKAGWKRFQDITYEDQFATLNPETNYMEYHRPSAIVHYSHHRQLLKIKNRATDLLVTLDHNMFGQEANAYRKNARWGFVKAKELPNQFVAPRSAQWVGREENTFILPAHPIRHYEGRQVRQKMSSELHLPMDDWLAFLGLWIAEGWTTVTSNYGVGIAQTNPRKKKTIAQVLAKLPFNFKRTRNGWICYNKPLWAYLRPLGGALAKFVPTEYKELSPRQLSILFDHACLGDGNLQKNGFRVYYTSSMKLADDVQEIMLKLGRVGIVKKRAPRKGKIGNRSFKVTHPAYEVIERVQKTVAWLDRRDCRTVPYHGAVHCVEVPFHTLYVRRNGKPIWCGNTSMYWSEPNTIFRMTLAKMKEALAKCGYVGYVDVNCIATSKAIYPLEFTCRFGYPTISIQLEGIQTPIGELLYRMASGENFTFKTKKGFQIGVVVAVPPFPYSDKETFNIYKDSSIIFKKENLDGVHIGDVKIEDGDWHLAGESGYVLVVTGSGTTMEEAGKQAYSRVRNILIQNMFYRTDIGARWYQDSDKLLTWGYMYERN